MNAPCISSFTYDLFMVKRAVFVLLVCTLVLCVGCDGSSPTARARYAQPREGLQLEVPTDKPERQSPRIKVVRLSIFKDELAYGGNRGVYLITDAETGTEFIGVSGVGIAETGSHRSGKHTTRDER